MNKHEMKHESAELETREGFEVQESSEETLEVVELDRAPLTDLNFGF